MSIQLDWSPYTKTTKTGMTFVEEREKARLNNIAAQMRLNVMKTMINADYGHPASCLGLCDLFTALYFGGLMKYSPSNPFWPDRDRLVVSCGHISALMYTALSMAGYFPAGRLDGYARAGGLPGHPHRCVGEGIENSSGSLGQGYGVGTGMALALKKTGQHVFLITSDGEQQEGQIWEACQVAVKYRLTNLTVFIDENGIQNSGRTADVMPSGDLAKKYAAFGFRTITLHPLTAFDIVQAVRSSRADRPVAVILKTVPGKGVSFMENNPDWHDDIPSGDLKKQALEELNKQKQRSDAWQNFLNKMELRQCQR
ncbi:MAG: transketolase [Alphaproteobacteria bacterium]|nr:transketolase [Alphaproteobacteria bacterium]